MNSTCARPQLAVGRRHRASSVEVDARARRQRRRGRRRGRASARGRRLRATAGGAGALPPAPAPVHVPAAVAVAVAPARALGLVMVLRRSASTLTSRYRSPAAGDRRRQHGDRDEQRPAITLNSARPVGAVAAHQRRDRAAADDRVGVAAEPLLDHRAVHRAVVGRHLQVALRRVVGGHEVLRPAAGPLGGEAAAHACCPSPASGRRRRGRCRPSRSRATRRPNSEKTSVLTRCSIAACLRGRRGTPPSARESSISCASWLGELAAVGVEAAPVDRDDPRAEVRRQQVGGEPQPRRQRAGARVAGARRERRPPACERWCVSTATPYVPRVRAR